MINNIYYAWAFIFSFYERTKSYLLDIYYFSIYKDFSACFKVKDYRFN